MGKKSWVICITTSILAIAMSIHLTGYIQEMSDIFVEGGFALPGITLLYLSASDSWLIGIGPLLAILLILKELLVSDEKIRLMFNVAGFIVTALCFGLGYWAMSLPNDPLIF